METRHNNSALLLCGKEKVGLYFLRWRLQTGTLLLQSMTGCVNVDIYEAAIKRECSPPLLYFNKYTVCFSLFEPVVNT